jgi:hypothetical protein
MKIPRIVFNYGVMFIGAPILTYLIFKPSKNLEQTLSVQPEVKRAIETNNKAKVVELILSKGEKKDELVNDLLKKGQR